VTRNLVSVIIPTYNRAYVLPRAVESVLAQTHPSVEVVLVDDGSNDGTSELVASRWGGDPRIRYVRQANAGASAARNHGIRLVEGDFAAFLDSDDEWLPWKLELQLAALAAFPKAGMVWTDMVAVGPAGETLDPRYLRHMYSAWSRFTCEQIFEDFQTISVVAPALVHRGIEDARIWFGDIFSPMVVGNLVHTSTVLLRRERLERVGTFDEALRFAGEDYEFHLRTCRAGSVAFADVPTIRYQRGMPDRLTRPDHSIHLALNFLTTITRTVARDADRIRLPRSTVRRVFADAHSWVGQVAFERGEHTLARRHLARSLSYRPLNVGVLVRAVASCLPVAWASALRRLRARRRAAP